MHEKELETFLRSRIPLSAAMAVEVRTASPSAVVIFAPLAPNLNHRDTAFGGSVSAVAILAAWSVLYVRMQAEGLAGRIVIRRNAMSYDRPIVEDFTASATCAGRSRLGKVSGDAGAKSHGPHTGPRVDRIRGRTCRRAGRRIRGAADVNATQE